MVIKVRRGNYKKTAAGALAAVLIAGAATSGIHYVRAAEDYTVADNKAVLYSTKNTTAYAAPDTNAQVITSINPNLPVDVTGVTSNGWFRINLGGTVCYVPGSQLQSEVSDSDMTYLETDIDELTKGTFTFYSNLELNSMTLDKVENMDANTYIKYLDSFLIGNANAQNCICQESGLTMKNEYDKAGVSADETLQDYLLHYRNKYLKDSFWGPVKNRSELKVTLNRGIRYNINSFSTVYRNASIGDDKDKMEELAKSVVSEVKEEQGVQYTYKMEYGSYKTSEGRTMSGWIIEFTK